MPYVSTWRQCVFVYDESYLTVIMEIIAMLTSFLCMLCWSFCLPWCDNYCWQGTITFHDVIDKSHDHGVAQIRLEGVYIWPFRQLRMVANRYMFNFIVLFFVITKRLYFSFVRAKILCLTFGSPTLALLVYATNCIYLKHRGQQTLIIKIALQQKDIFILLCPLRTFACFLNVNLGQQSTTTLS